MMKHFNAVDGVFRNLYSTTTNCLPYTQRVKLDCPEKVLVLLNRSCIHFEASVREILISARLQIV